MTLQHQIGMQHYTPLPLRFHRQHSSNPSSSSAIEDLSSGAPKNPNCDKIETHDPPKLSEAPDTTSRQTKTVAQTDQELFEKLESMCGGGGAAALELENGKPVTMKRGVKDNMFRLI